MRKILILAALAVAGMLVGGKSTNAAMVGMPMGLKSAILHIKFFDLTAPLINDNFTVGQDSIDIKNHQPDTSGPGDCITVCIGR